MKSKKIIVFILAALLVVSMLPVYAFADAGYTVTYDVNGATGGTAPADSTVYNSGDPVTVLGNTGSLEKTGCTFSGWNTAADGSGTAYAEANTFSISDNVILYAAWLPLPCTVKYNTAGGSAVSDWTGSYGDTIPAAPSTTRTGFDFCGWYTDSSLTAAAAFPYKVVGDATLYAKWQPQTAYLLGVTLSAGKLSRGFSKNVYSYKVMLDENTASVTIMPVAENSKAVVTINKVNRSAITVNVDNNKTKVVTVKVRYGDKVRVYTFVVKRAKATNNNLASLTVSAGTLSPAFDPSVTKYTLSLDASTSSVTVTAVAASNSAKILSAKKTTYTLKNGHKKTIKIMVKAKQGKPKTYTITITRANATSNSNGSNSDGSNGKGNHGNHGGKNKK